MFLRFVQVVEFVTTSFLCHGEHYSTMWTDHGLLIYPPVDGRLCRSHLLGMADNATVNIRVQVFV